MIIKEYHRPATLEEALALLNRAQVITAPLAGGTVVNGLPEVVPESVVDLQSLGLDGISSEGDQVRIGAMCTLQQIVDSGEIPEFLRDLAHREAPSTIRNAATVGGTVAAADADSGFLAGLLAGGATAEISSPAGTRTDEVADLVGVPEALEGAIITSIFVPSGGTGAFEWTSRTPADIPIVLVAGYQGSTGESRFAATGVGTTPSIVGSDLPSPPGDFRGSTAYRQHLVGVLVDRVRARLGGSE